MDKIREALPPKWGDEFKTYIKKKERPSLAEDEHGTDSKAENDNVNTVIHINAKKRFDYMLRYMSKFLQNISFNINFDLSVAKKEKKKPETAKPSHQGEKEKGRGYAMTNDPALAGGQAKASKEAASKKRPTNSSQMPPLPPCHQQHSKAAGPIIQATYHEPTKVQCKLCPTQHTHILYCKSFMEANPLERRKFCHEATVCFRCLRMDSRVDVSRIRKWWTQHDLDCQTEWVCQVQNCPKRPKFWQFHMLLCGYHDNSCRESDFVKSLDSKQLPAGGARFFVSHPVFFSAPPVAAPATIFLDGYEVEQDINNNSIFMLHDYEVNGVSLLVFYDGGCLSKDHKSTR